MVRSAECLIEQSRCQCIWCVNPPILTSTTAGNSKFRAKMASIIKSHYLSKGAQQHFGKSVIEDIAQQLYQYIKEIGGIATIRNFFVKHFQRQIVHRHSRYTILLFVCMKIGIFISRCIGLATLTCNGYTFLSTYSLLFRADSLLLMLMGSYHYIHDYIMCYKSTKNK